MLLPTHILLVPFSFLKTFLFLRMAYTILVWLYWRGWR